MDERFNRLKAWMDGWIDKQVDQLEDGLSGKVEDWIVISVCVGGNAGGWMNCMLDSWIDRLEGGLVIG